MSPDLMLKIYEELYAQRSAHDFTAQHDDLHTPYTWVALACRQAGLAIDDGGPPVSVIGGYDEARFEQQMVRVAAVALAAIESRRRLVARHRSLPSRAAECDRVPNKES